MLVLVPFAAAGATNALLEAIACSSHDWARAMQRVTFIKVQERWNDHRGLVQRALDRLPKAARVAHDIDVDVFDTIPEAGADRGVVDHLERPDIAATLELAVGGGN
jgi:hypothetical protein